MIKPKLSLSKKALLALALILLPIAITFAWGYKTNKTLLTNQVLTDMTLISEGVEAKAYAFLSALMWRTAEMATDRTIAAELKKAGSPRWSPSLLGSHIEKSLLPSGGRVDGVLLLTLGGQALYSTYEDISGRDYSGDSLFIEGAKGTFMREFAPKGPMPAMLAASAPVRGPEGELLGVLVGFARASELGRSLSAKSVPEAGPATAHWERLDSYIVNSERLVIAASGLAGDAAFGQRVDTAPVAACLERGQGLAEFYSGRKGTAVAGASLCMPGPGWVLLVELDARQALEPVHSIGKSAAATAVLVAALITGIFLAFHKTIVMQLRAVSEAAAKIAGGNFDHRLAVKTNDELGALSGSFNYMASEIRQRSLSLARSEERLKRAQEVARLGSWEWNISANTLWWSDEIYRIFGLKPQEFGATYEAFLDTVHPDDREFVKASVEHAFTQGQGYSIDHRIVLPDGSVKIVHEEADVLGDEQGKPFVMTGTVQDVTEQKKAEFELKKVSAVLEHSVNLVFITDKNGAIQYVNPTFERVTGYAREEALGQTPRILASGDVTNAQYQELWSTILSGRTWRSTFKNKKKSGGHYWANTVITPIKNDRGEITSFLAVQEDVTEKMASEERLTYLASHDGLTGLTNRARFIEQVQEWIVAAGAGGQPGALCIMDIDQFKLMNDTFGHGAGDEYLRRVSNILKGVMEELHRLKRPASPLLSRLSGDEFAVFLPGLSGSEALKATEKMRKAVEGFYFADASSSLTASTGVSVYPEHGASIKELLTRADIAMYRAKELGRNRAYLYHAEDQDLEKMHSRLSWKEKILKGLREDRFVPWFQPMLDLSDNTIHHYEVLARLIDEDGKVILPGAFIDIAERFGIIGLIDRVIVEKAMRAQAGMRRQGLAVSLGMNLSGKELGDADVLVFIKDKIMETGADPKGLVFEITETAAIGDIEKASRFVKSLKAIGCKFSLDDFGVGFTSFTYLKEMQVDYIKIDGSFIRKLHENKDDQVVVKAMTDLARGLSIKSVAEFVEDERTLELLRTFGVDYAQGYFIGKPSSWPSRFGQTFDLSPSANKTLTT